MTTSEKHKAEADFRVDKIVAIIGRLPIEPCDISTISRAIRDVYELGLAIGINLGLQQALEIDQRVHKERIDAIR